MAGIISNVTGDIQRLRDLKTAIEDVKKSLMSINIKVNIDMKENLEAKLKSLTDQYMELGTKVALTEAKINQSAQNIVKAAQKITEAQDKMSKAPINAIPTSGGSVSVSNTPAISAEKVEVIAQAKAYNELKEQIGDIIGARGQNIKRMIEEQNAIRLINAEIKQITKSQGEYSNVSASQQKRLEQLNNSLLAHKTVLAEVRQNLSNNVKLDNAAATSMNELSQSLSRMRIAYRELTEEERKSPFGKELLTSINRADAEIKGLDATIGNHARNVGNYKAKWDGLGMSIQQIGREMPSLAYGPKVFFSAISNNLPILADELKRAKAEFKALKAEGKDATPVWKQVTSSLLSWQTALTVGVTLLTLYGDKLVDLVSGLFNAKNAAKELLSTEQEMALARKKSISDSTKERAELDLLYSKLKSTTTLTKERNAAVSEWTKRYPQHSNIMNGELVSLGKLSSAYQSLSKQIIETAKARAYSDKITGLETKKNDTLTKRQNQYVTYLKAIEEQKKAVDEYNKKEKTGFGTATAKIDAKDKIFRAEQNAKDQKKAWLDLIEVTNAYDKSISIISKNIKVDDLFPQPKEGTYDYWQQQVQIADTALKQIASKQKKILDNAAKEPKKDLYALGIDKSIVDSYKSAVKAKKEAEKELEAYPSSSESSKQENQAEKLREQQEKLMLLTNKQALDQSRSEQDLQNQVDQARIDAMKDGSTKTIEQMQLNHKQEMQQFEREKEDKLRKAIEDARTVFDAKENEAVANDPKHVKQTFDASGVKLSDSDIKQYDTQKMYLDLKQASETQAFLDKDRQSWNEYLVEYGSFQEKKQAITTQYNEKIANASTEGEKASLKKELKGKQKDLNLEEIKSSINFADIFGNLDAQSTEALSIMRDKLKDVINKSAKDLKPTDLKALQDAFTDIDLKISERNPFGELKQGIDDYKESTKSVIKAQEDLNTVQQGGEVIVGLYTDATGKVCKKLLTQEQAERNLSDAQRDRRESQIKLTESVNSIGEKGQQLVTAGSDITDMLTSLGVSIPDSISGALDGIGQVMDSMASIDITKPMSIITGITGSLAGIGKAIGSIFGGSSDGTKVYEDMKEQLSAINEIYEKIIENSKEEIVFGGGFASIEAANNALDTYYKKVENYRRLADAAGGAGASAGSHSYAYRTNKNLSGDWGNISRLIGKNISGIQDMYNLTGEQLYLIQTKMPDAWNKISSDIKNNLNAIIDCKDEARELADALNAAMTGVDTDSFYNGFIDSLSDMDTSFEDMCDNFEGYLRKSIIAGLVASQYQGRIDSLYKKWSDAAVSDKKITEEESKALQDEYKKIVEDMMKDREDMANSFGWESSESTSQDSTKGGFATASQDSISELNGRFTAFQESNEGIRVSAEEVKNQNILQSQSLNLLTFKADAILMVNTETRNIADETRTILANSYLELVQISENTGESAKYLKDIKSDIAEVKRNTSRI